MSQSFPFVSRIPGDNSNSPSTNGFGSSAPKSPTIVSATTKQVEDDAQTRSGPKPKKKVVIAGAGIAGLRAAAVLHRHGVEVVVLEARDRIGGRIWTLRSDATGKPGVVRDMGAAWLHETAHNPLTRLIREIGLTYYYDDGTPLYYTKYGRTSSQFKAKKVAEEFADFAEWYYRVNPKAKDKSVDAFIRKFVERHELISNDEKLWAPQAIRDVEHMLGTTTMESSAKHLCYFGWPERNLYVKGGYDGIVEWTSQSLKEDGATVQLNRIVKQVDWSDDGFVSVRHKGVSGDEMTVVSADAVVVAVPLGCLHHKMLSFSPALPSDIQEGISKISYGVLGKVFFEFSEVFWSKENDQLIYIPSPSEYDDDDDEGSSSSSEKLGPADSILNYPTTTVNLSLIADNSKELCIQIVEPLAQLIEGMGNDKDRIYKFFVPLFKLLRTESSKALPPLVNLAVTNWSCDPLAGFGTFATEKVGDEPELLLEALERHSGSHLQFAGDHCADVGCGCVHGAISSGELAATNLLKSFGIPYDGGDLATIRCDIDSDDE